MKTKHLLLSAAAAALAATASLSGPAGAQEHYIGEVRAVGFGFCPVGWAPAEGQLLAISANEALFSLYGTIYGGNGRTTFALPDLRGRVPISDGTGAGLSTYKIGQRGGAESFNLSGANNAAHGHGASTTATLNATADNGNTDTPGSTVVLANARGTDIYGTGTNGATFRSNAISATTTTTETGGSQTITQRGPYETILWCVSLSGIYPSRN